MKVKRLDEMICDCIQNSNYQVPIDDYAWVKNCIWLSLFCGLVFPTTGTIAMTEGQSLIYGTLPSDLSMLALYQIILGSILVVFLLVIMRIENNPGEWNDVYRYIITFIWIAIGVAVLVIGIVMI